MKTIAFFNARGTVGSTVLVYHLAWMLAERGERVLAVDLDPQASLTGMMLPRDTLEDLWPKGAHPDTVFGALQPIVLGIGEAKAPHVEPIDARIGLVVGDLALATLEGRLADVWSLWRNRDESALRILIECSRAVEQSAIAHGATWVLIDLGPNLGAINRAALLASPYIAIPLAPDLWSVQGLRNLGPVLRDWRSAWQELSAQRPDSGPAIPAGRIEPLGYVVMQHALGMTGPSSGYRRWAAMLPAEYRESLLDESASRSLEAADDPYCLATLNHYRSLMPMAMDARKPVFALKPADGAIGAHGEAVRFAYRDFLALARRIAERCGTAIS